jgi:uncharacterized protein
LTGEPVAAVEPPQVGDFEQACWRLAGFDRRLSPEWVDGYLAGVLAGPRAIAPAEWLPAMLGETFARVFADPIDERFARRALASRWRELSVQLDAEALLAEPDAIHLRPWILEHEESDRADFVARGLGSAEQAQDELQGGVDWSRGFLRALADFAADWTGPAADDPDARAYHDAMARIQALQLPAAGLRQHLDSAYPQGHPSRDELIDDACLAAQDLRRWWVDHAPRPATRRGAAQPGRNDPCPCGSGRKFKKCHGA